MVVRDVLARGRAFGLRGALQGSNGLGYILIVVLISAWISPLSAYEENDFDFGDRLRGTLLDDEDLMHDDPGSGPEDGDYSGTTMEMLFTDEKVSIKPIFPSYTSTTPHHMEEIDQYRGVINFTSLRYSVALNNTSSSEYIHHSRSIKAAIENIYQRVPGQQTVNVVQFRLSSASAGAPPSVMVTTDLHTSGYYDRIALFNVLNNAVNSGIIGTHRVSPNGFEFRPYTVSTLTPFKPKPTCSPVTQFRCFNGACIDTQSVCDGRFDCTDRSDEYNCTTEPPKCQLHEFRCDNGQCIDERRKCDNYQDCSDGSDEDSRCPPVTCATHEFQCDNKECVDIQSLCDGHRDCIDGSDEDDRKCEKITCKSWQFTCLNGDCIDERRRCDGNPDCRDRSDEHDCPIYTTKQPSTTTQRQLCRSSQFQCSDGRCIEEHQRCDGRADCSEEEDESLDYCEDCPEPKDPVDGWVTVDGRRAIFRCHTTRHTWQLVCSRRRWIGEVGNCTQRDGLPRICSSADFQCRDGTCIPAKAHCDRKYDCSDYSDEVNCTNTVAPPTQCTSAEFQCGDGSCIDRRRHCDNNYDCRDGSDEQNCYTPPPSRLCASWEYRCQDGTCIDQSLRCNRQYDCPDGTDETIGCDAPTTARACASWQYQCQDGTCIDQNLRCNRQYDCPDGTDETVDCNVITPPRECSSWEFRCGDGTCIDERLKCNQHYDCQDGTDETVDCESISVSASPGEMRIREGMTATFVCRSHGSPQPQLRWSRDAQALPRQAVDDFTGRLTISDARLEDSGVYTCSAVGTRGTYEAKVTLHVDLVFGPTRIPNGPRQCYNADEFMCNNRACIPPDYRCDGDYDCTDRSDEENCRDESVSCEPNEFRCTTNNKCILKIWVCDGDDDCGGDRSDEAGCDTFPTQYGCRKDEFQCRAGGQCIPAGYQCDGERDCLDSSDEYGCSRPTGVKAPPREIVVHHGERIEIDCEAIGVPPPLIVWRLNWGHVGQPPRVTTTSERIEERPGRPITGRGVIVIEQARKEDEGAYTCEALNSMGSIFVEPDTIVHVLPPKGVCPRGYFNSEAHVANECIRCFCFGLADDCTSSSLFLSEISIGNALEIVDRFNRRPLDGSVYRYDGRSREFVIADYPRTVRGAGYYWSLPKHFLENKVTSYGGKLSYTVYYSVLPGSRPYLESGPDVILSGNGITLYHNAFVQPFAGAQQTASVSLKETFWSLDEQGARKATRENLMTALQNLDYILIKSNYDRDQNEVRLSRVSLTVTTPQTTSLGKAVLVEQCSCPVGYTGPSCDQCTPGFRRTEERGQYIGQCAGCNCHGHSNECDPRTGLCQNCRHNTEGDRCERCKPGFFGNALRGTPDDCRPCPCPPADGGAFATASECDVEVDGEITCRSCPLGYTGRHCQSCAPGYQIQPGGTCILVGQHCDPRGSLSATADPRTGNCQCKQFADGPTCSQCRKNTFYPAAVNPFGCVPCFCMGVTQSCTSTTWNRAQATVAFRSDPQGFVLTSRGRDETITEGIIVDRANQDIRYRTFHNLPQREYYWSLPAKFLRNKVTSYGGNLRFTVQHLPGFSRTPTGYPDVEISGNDIILEYRNNVPIPANAPTIISVPFYENYWRRADQTMATREHLMMVLADLEFIMIKAKYTEDPVESSLKDVNLDVAENRNTGQERAFAVEECMCPPGYRGLSCEFCDTGYRRSGGGLYLGTCEPCDCYGHSSECDTTTGLCKNCQHNTAGERCDMCAPGYYGDATRGQPNDCLPCPCPLSSPPNQFSQECLLGEDGQVTCSACPLGHTGRRCESCGRGYTGNPFAPGDFCRPEDGNGGDCRCDPRGVVPNTRCDSRTGQCQCKTYASGLSCNECRPGYFSLSLANPSGCLPCYCMGLTRECTSSRYYKSEIKPVFQPDGSHNFALTTKRLSQQITDGFRVNAPASEISFEGFADIQRQGESLYWNLPPRFRGNKVTSYGGLLKFLLSYSATASRGRTYQDTDVELISGDQRLYSNLRAVTEAPTRHEITLVESSFRQIDGASPTRETFLNVLAKLEAILIRATYHTSMQRSSLRDVSLDTAVPYNTGREIASMVEDCSCPAGYTGLSCEDCADGYSRVQLPGSPLGICALCTCYGHSTSCDPSTGACTNCQHNTVGDRCDRCAAGYYGDPRAGSPHDCRPCPCPLTIPGNQFSRTCLLDEDGSPTCDQCAEGYTGRQCDQCAAGYGGNPRQPGGSCIRESVDNRPQISISPLRLSTSVGGSVTFQCTVQGQGPFNIQWMRADGRPLPVGRAVIGGDYSLRITDLRPSDSGRYICAAVNAFGRSQLEAELSVLDDRQLQVIVNDPKQQTVIEGSNVQFYCIGISPNVYTVAWTRKDGRPLDPRVVDDGHGTLTIRSVKREDVGTYVCTGSDYYNVATDEAYLAIRGGDRPPQARIEPSYVTASAGAPVELRCIVSGYPAPTIEWSGGPGGVLPRDAIIENDVLRFQAVSQYHEGEYHCTAINQAGRSSVRATIAVQEEVPGFEVVINQPELRVRPGEEAKVDCVARSHIKVEAIKWTKHGDTLPPGSYQVGGQLVIPECRPEFSGRYICTIYLVNGDRKVAYSSISISDEEFPDQVEAPRVTMDPEFQRVNEGSTGTIRCLVTGSPTPVITWSRSRGPLGRNHQVLGNTLRIQEATDSDRDSYICTATNSAGSARGVATLDIERQEYPAVDIYPGDVIDVQVGDNALFQCLATAGSPTLTWRRANNEPFTRNTEVTEGSGAIRFIQVTGDEQGSYICTGTSNAGTTSATATLRVQGTLRVSIRPSNAVRVVAGQRLFAECVVEGDPSANVYWLTPANAIFQGRQEGSAILDISSPTTRDSGIYRCIARSEQGQAEGLLQVTVAGIDSLWTTLPPDGHHVSAAVQPQQIRVALGQAAEFRCSATGLTPPSLHWTKVDGHMPDTHYVRDGVLRIERVSEADAGTYKCIARSQYGSGEVSVQLHVLVPPLISISPTMQTLRPGDHFLIQCTARGTEPIEIEWSKLYGSLSPTATEHRGVLEISSVTAADSGRYKCTASNDAGRAESLAELIILAPPGAIVSPKTTQTGVGQTVEFRCEVTGSPHPRIQWLKHGGTLPEQHSVEAGTLTLFNIQTHDEGQYICMVTNEVGTTRDYGQLRVTGTTGPIHVPDRKETLQVGDRIEINCEVTGEPLPVVKWIKVDGPMSPHIILEDTHLIIPSAMEEDQGTYRCVATSVTGTVYAQVTLIVDMAPTIPVTRQSRTVSTGGRAVLTCRAHGDPTPVVRWSKRDGVLPRNHEAQNGVLIIPIVRPEDFGEYVCTATNIHGSADGVIILQSGELVPFFSQNPISYMSYPTIRDAYKTFDIDISIKPQTTDGLILYNGQLDDGTGDFVSFGLRNRRAELRLDVGSGPAIITTDPIELDQWHTITVKRDGKDASVFVDGHEYKGQAPGSFIGLDLTENMYLGAVPDFRRISRLAGYTKGFVGCISQVVVSGVPLNLGGEVLDNDGITDCPVCQYRPCRHGGTCRPARVEMGYECFCPRNYSGTNCELLGERCAPGTCGRRGRCQNLEEGTGYRCSCPVGITGEWCQLGSEVSRPSFNSSSYIAYPTIRDALLDVQLKLTFRADSPNNALLLYNGFSRYGDGDFIAITIRDGYIHFQFDTGTGAADIQSREPVAVGQWTTVVAERSRQDGSLYVNNGIAVKGKSPDPERGTSFGDTVGLNLKTNLYVGGVSDLRIAPAAGILAGFKGCISELEIGGSRVDMINEAISFRHVSECGTGRPCASLPCQNDGTCLERGDSFTCVCQMGFRGTVCETRTVVEKHAEFEGDGFVELPAELLPHLSPLSTETIEFSVTTTDPDALLFWHGQPSGTQLRGNDYISVALEGGRVVFSYELGSGVASIVSNEEINDGATHHIKVERTGKQGTLEVDGFAMYAGESGGDMTGLNTLGNIYLGGLPDFRTMTGGKYSRGLVGCISNVHLELGEPLDLSKVALQGVNVKPCSS